MSRSIRPLDDEPVQIKEGDHYHWTVPVGYKHPSCGGCGHLFYELKPERSVGGASVPTNFLCRWCQEELENT